MYLFCVFCVTSCMSWYVMFCHDMLYYDITCYVTLYYAMLYHVMLCYIILCYVILLLTLVMLFSCFFILFLCLIQFLSYRLATSIMHNHIHHLYSLIYFLPLLHSILTGMGLKCTVVTYGVLIKALMRSGKKQVSLLCDKYDRIK